METSVKMMRENNRPINEYGSGSYTSRDSSIKYQSRKEIINALEKMGVHTDALSSLSIEKLHELLVSLQSLVSGNSAQKRPGRPRNTDKYFPILSETDKKILKHLLSSNGYVSSLVLSKELSIPLSTVQRRRKRLESNLIERNYSLKVEKFGWRMATLYISTTSGKTSSVGKDILEMTDTVISVVKTLGENTMDLKVDLIFRTNQELLSLIDRFKSHGGVRNIFWSESVETVGKSNKCYQQIIDSY